MNGNPATPQRRKVQALSVSVDYADYLECIAPNVRHFDKWLVVTEERDVRTREVCRRHGMEVLFSRRLRADGAPFHKAAALNEGLAALDQDAWVAVMDSDILLPQDFGPRLAAQDLDPLCLYGLAGRRICPTLAEFQTLAAREPWADNLIYTTFVIGYFNLFHLGQPKNRYPEDGSRDASTYDVEFSNSFPAARRKYLPFVCLHAGATSQNWSGRTTDPFLETSAPRSGECSTAKLAALLGGPGTHAVQLGCYRGEPGITLAKHFSRVTVMDHWGLEMRAAAPGLETDLAMLRTRYAEETAGLTNLTPPREHSDETLAAIPDGSLDALWFTPEPEYDLLLEILPSWLPKLKPGGAIAGGYYDPELLPGPSRLVQLCFGEPDLSFPDMQWMKRIADPAGCAARLFPPACEGGARGVIYVATGEQEVEALLVSLSSLQRHWSGPVCIINAGDEIPSLRLACTRLGLAFRNVPETLNPEFTLLHALDWSPFEETVCLQCATLVRGPVDWLFDALSDDRDNAFCAEPGRPAAATAFAWRRGSIVPDAWRTLAAGVWTAYGKRAVTAGLTMLAGDGKAHLLTQAPVWSGPVKRAPADTCILALPRLARAGALHLYPPWAEEEQAMLKVMQRPPG